MHQKNVSFVTSGFGFQFEEHVSNKCHALLAMDYSLKNIAILNAKGATLSVFWWVLVKMKV